MIIGATVFLCLKISLFIINSNKKFRHKPIHFWFMNVTFTIKTQIKYLFVGICSAPKVSLDLVGQSLVPAACSIQEPNLDKDKDIGVLVRPPNDLRRSYAQPPSWWLFISEY